MSTILWWRRKKEGGSVEEAKKLREREKELTGLEVNSHDFICDHVTT
jgi:hypothetical protein